MFRLKSFHAGLVVQAVACAAGVAGAACMALAAAPAQARELGADEAARLVASGNADVIAARRAVEAARAMILQADVAPNPALSFNSTGIGRELGPGAPWSKRIDHTLRLDQPIERGNKRGLRVAQAKNAEAATRLDLAETLRRQRVAVGSAYVDLQLAQERVVLQDDSAAIMARMLAGAQVRLRAGDLAPADVARIQVDAERAAADARAARGDLARAQVALTLLLGLTEVPAELHASDNLPAASNDPLDTVDMVRLIEQRVDVRAARQRIVAAESGSALARAQRTRDITVGVQVERYPGSSPMNSVGVGISVPLFTGNYFEGDIAAAEADRGAASDNLMRVQAAARAEIVAAASDLRVARERLARYEGGLLTAAKRSADAAEFAFTRGALSVLELLDARRSYRGVQLEALAARADHARALAAWRLATTSAEEPEPTGMTAAALQSSPNHPLTALRTGLQ